MHCKPIKPATALSIAMLLVLACVYPTDESEKLRVVMQEIPNLLEGELHRLRGTVVDGQGSTMPNVEVSFTSDNSLVATVVSESDSMLATGPGLANITASAVGYALAEPAVQEIKIHNLIEIDSVRPRILRYGDTLQIFGSGLNPQPFGPGSQFILASIGNAEAPPKSYLPQDADNPNRFGRLTVWVPPPTPAFGLVAVFGVNGLAIHEEDTLAILPFDVYEPNDTIPWDFGPLDGAVRNPALAFEKRPRGDSTGGDWYRFEQTSVGDRTVIIRSNQVGPETYQVFFTNSLNWDGIALDFSIGPAAWTIGPSLYACEGFPFAPPQLPADSVVIALRDLPVGTYDFIAAYNQAGGYELNIVPTYRSALPPDQAEENDFCDVATPFTVGQSRDLTIDNPRDIDWFKFSLGGDQDVSFDVTAGEAEADLDIYVLQDYLPDSLSIRAVSQIGGASDAVSATLTSGDYFLVVVDFAGVPTAYNLASAANAVSVPTSSTAGPVIQRQAETPMILRKRP